MNPLGIDSDQYLRVLKGLATLCVVLAIGTAGYILIEGWSFIDALYMSVTTITTVGFREVRPLSTEGRIFTIFLVLFGVGVAFYILTALVAAIIEGDLRQLFGARRMRYALERVSDHFIVCGYGRVGEEVCQELKQRKVPFVVIDINAAAADRARSEGMLAVTGDAATEETLKTAGIEKCQALIAASDSDATNIFITLTARGLRKDVLLVARVSTLDVEAKLRQAGADRVVSPYTMGGRRLALSAMQPLMADFMDIVRGAQGERILGEFLVDEDSGLAGRELAEALSSCRDVVTLAVRDAAGSLSVGPPASTRLKLGDRLLVVGEEGELRTIGVVSRPSEITGS